MGKPIRGCGSVSVARNSVAPQGGPLALQGDSRHSGRRACAPIRNLGIAMQERPTARDSGSLAREAAADTITASTVK